jgi:hypothetical protein
MLNEEVARIPENYLLGIFVYEKSMYHYRGCQGRVPHNIALSSQNGPLRVTDL